MSQPSIKDINERSREILRLVVEAYVETGEPVGSRTLSRKLGLSISPATVRNAMADLEEMGVLYSPHTSAGRLPTDMGLRLFVDGLLELGNLSAEERNEIEGHCAASGKSLPEVLQAATGVVSGLAHCVGMVVAPKLSEPLKHIEFVSLGPGRALVVMVMASGTVENRILDVPIGLPPSSLVEASNYLSDKLVGRTLPEAQRLIRQEMEQKRAELDDLTRRVVESGLATWTDNPRDGALILSGQSKLLEDITALEDLEKIRRLFHLLETRETYSSLLDLTDNAEGVQIFIGSESELFSLSGCSLVIAPYNNAQQQIVGAIGVIGPTRINYARIIPMVDFTARVISRLIG